MADRSDSDIVEAFLERAAIIEYDAGHSRDHAEYLAAREVRADIWPRKLPSEIGEIMRRSRDGGR